MAPKMGDMRLTETILNEGLSADAVDEANGVIKGVALLGRESKNGRTYSPQAMQDAARLYENNGVNIDHRSKKTPASERGFMESGGIIKNARVTDKGDKVRGDFHYLKTHPASPMLVERAQRFPESFGFSHDAEGETKKSSSGLLVESLSEVHSIDVVLKPATNAGLFESEDTQMARKKTRTAKFSEIVEATTDSKLKAIGTALLEMDAVAADMPVDLPPAPAANDGDGADSEEGTDPNEDMKAALKKAGAGVWAKVVDGDLEWTEAAKKLKDMAGVKDKLDQGSDTADAGTADAAAADSVVAESLRKLESKYALLEAEALLLKQGRDATDARIKAVAKADSKNEKTALVESWPAKDAKQGFAKPDRTGSKFPLRESEEDGTNEFLPSGKPAWQRLAKAKA